MSDDLNSAWESELNHVLDLARYHLKLQQYKRAQKCFASSLKILRKNRKSFFHKKFMFNRQLLRAKLEHDLLQLQFLQQKKHFQNFSTKKIENLENVVRKLKGSTRSLNPSDFQTVEELIGSFFHIYRPAFSKQKVINPLLRRKDIEAVYLKQGYVVIDDLLTKTAVKKVQKFLLYSTLWSKVTPRGVYGTKMIHGFYCGLLFQVASELTQRFPKIFKDTYLHLLWAYLYLQNSEGLKAHEDPGEVNVNYWPMPNSTNLDPQSGGMILYPRNTKRSAVTIPYKSNRVVFFRSKMLHATDKFCFGSGYKDYRRSVTYVFEKQ
jgi:hypothetical protein